MKIMKKFKKIYIWGIIFILIYLTISFIYGGIQPVIAGIITANQAKDNIGNALLFYLFSGNFLMTSIKAMLLTAYVSIILFISSKEEENINKNNGGINNLPNNNINNKNEK